MRPSLPTQIRCTLPTTMRPTPPTNLRINPLKFSELPKRPNPKRISQDATKPSAKQIQESSVLAQLKRRQEAAPDQWPENLRLEAFVPGRQLYYNVRVEMWHQEWWGRGRLTDYRILPLRTRYRYLRNKETSSRSCCVKSRRALRTGSLLFTLYKQCHHLLKTFSAHSAYH